MARPADLLKAGFQIFPCKGKVPMTKHGVKDASDDPDVVMAWQTRLQPTHWAVACGKASGIVVIDVDVGEEPLLATLRKLYELGFLDNNVVSTPSGGLHVYCEYWPGLKNKVRLLKMPVDIRTDGGYVIASGPGYRVLDWDGNFGMVPEWIIEACKPKQVSISQRAAAAVIRPGDAGVMAREMLKVGEGSRNHQLFRLACWAIRDGGDLNALASAAAQTGLPQWEINMTINSARNITNAEGN